MENQNIKPNFPFMPEGTGTNPVKTYTKEEMTSLIAGWVDEMMEAHGFNNGDISEIYKIFKEKNKNRNNTILSIGEYEFRKYTESLGFFQLEGSPSPNADVAVEFRKAFFTKLMEKGFTQFILPGRHGYGISRDAKRVDPFMLVGPAYIPTRKNTNVAYLVEPIINGEVVGTALKTIHYNTTTGQYEYPAEGEPFEAHTLLFTDPTYAYQLALFQATNMIGEGDKVDFAIAAFDINKLYEKEGYHITLHTDLNAFSVAQEDPNTTPLGLKDGEYFTLVSKNYKIDSLQTSAEAVGAELIDEILEGYPVGLKPNRLMETFTTNGVKLDIYRYGMVIPEGDMGTAPKTHTDELIINEAKRLTEVFEIKGEPHLDALGYNLGGGDAGVIIIFNHVEQNEKFKPILPLTAVLTKVFAVFSKQKNKLENIFAENTEFTENLMNHYGMEVSTILEKPISFEELLRLVMAECSDESGVKSFKDAWEWDLINTLKDGVLKTMAGDYTEEELNAQMTSSRMALHLSELIFHEEFQSCFNTRICPKSNKIFISPNFHKALSNPEWSFNPNKLSTLIWDEWGGVNSELPYVNLNEQEQVVNGDNYLVPRNVAYEVFLTSNNHLLFAYAVFPEGTGKEEMAEYYKQKVKEGRLFHAYPTSGSEISNYAESLLATSVIVPVHLGNAVFKHHGTTYVFHEVFAFQEHIFQD